MKRRSGKSERAKAIRDLALELIQEKGQWKKFGRGPDVKVYEDECFLIFFYIRPPEPQGLHSGLYSLEMWVKDGGKVLNLGWDSAGDDPRIVSFHRGKWEQAFLSCDPNER